MKNKIKKYFSKSALFLSILYALFILMGKAIKNTGTIDILFSSLKKSLINIIFFLLLTSLFYIIIIFLFSKLDKKKNNKTNKLYDLIFSNNSFSKLFIIFFILGLPIVIIYFPGPLQWDGLRQLNYYFDLIPWTNHHPAFSTLVMGLFMKLGRLFGSDTLGVFFFNITEYILSCMTFAYMLTFMHKYKAPRWLIIFSFCFFGLNPIWQLNGYTFIKDTIFYLALCIFAIKIIEYYENKKVLPSLLLSALVLFLFRNNGFHIVLITFIVLFFAMKNKRKVNGLIIILIVITNIAYGQVLKLSGISKGNIHEALSVPLQQTARYLKYYEVTSEEEKVLEKLFDRSIKELQESYVPEISDPIKYSFEVSGKEELLSYFKIWFNGLCTHPKVYVDAFLENYYGYVYPFRKEYKDGLAYFTIEDNPKVDLGGFNVSMISSFAPARNAFEKSLTTIRNIPIIELLFNTGTYSWILLFFLAYALHQRKYQTFIVCMPTIIMFIFLFLSPVNAYVRYMNPIIVTLPIVISYILAPNKKNKTN